ncbi:MAG TPA: hypothetical protein VFU22_21895 [Roseiflexaceae bacterium]|nr:hypothetical protein [Roseiflexaceae bacterium]
MSPDQTSLDQATIEEMARLRAQILGDIDSLRRLVDNSWQLIEDVRRRRAAQTQARAVSLTDQKAEHERGTA